MCMFTAGGVVYADVNVSEFLYIKTKHAQMQSTYCITLLSCRISHISFLHILSCSSLVRQQTKDHTSLSSSILHYCLHLLRIVSEACCFQFLLQISFPCILWSLKSCLPISTLSCLAMCLCACLMYSTYCPALLVH